ncbi:hydroxymethylpyrimidine/phosphomethylpyrimidine kinase [Desulfurobacterium sp.]|uniref:hydroxymethylpyrimidine/phosphomethylpyrimidine kinase n=1 Tax=Desulfurobacterium sp. TaxID=2004706 RepID=UPI00260C1D8C|nr:hydroxymethylpyrimidine/phosphomethylpyrimidine kinase [Desulfurobacterium sp.]
MEKPDVLLTIAGFDPTGGAGILRDISTFRHFGFYGTAVITANTSQNTKGVTDVLFQPPELIKKQIKAVDEDFSIAGIKIGLPHYDKTLNTWIAEFITEKKIPAVFDPVLKPTLGKAFVKKIETIEPLMKASTVITPNYSEYQKLRGYLKSFRGSIVVKGIFENNTVKDILIQNGKKTEIISHTLRSGEEVRGTGCAFSSALLALIIKKDLKTAFREASQFLQDFRKKALSLESRKQKINLDII